MNYRSLGNGINGAVECIDTLANILALTLGTSVTQTTVPVRSKARPTDVAGCTLEMGADGLWTGHVGSLTLTKWSALDTSKLSDNCTWANVNSFCIGGKINARSLSIRDERSGTSVYSGHEINTTYGWKCVNDAATCSVISNTECGRDVLSVYMGDSSKDRYTLLYRAFPKLIRIGRRITVRVYVPYVQQSAANLTVTFGYSSDAPASYPPTVPPTNVHKTQAFSYVLYQGWNDICLPIDSLSLYGQTWVTSGSPNINGLQQIYFSIYCNTNVPAENRTILIDTITVDDWNSPLGLVRIDGYAEDLVKYGATYLSDHNIPANVFIDGNTLTSDRVGYLEACLSLGFNVGTQGMNHKNYVTYTDQLDADCATAEENHVAAGLPKPTLFAYPANASNSDTDAILSARGYKFGSGSGTPIGRQHLGKFVRLGTISCAGTRTAAEVLADVDFAISCGGDFVLLFHDIVPTVTDTSLQTSQTMFCAILDGLANRRLVGLNMVTAEQYCSYFLDS